MKISEFCEQAAATAKSALKLLLQSRHADIRAEKRDRPLIIMGNGPSLRQVLDNERDSLAKADLLAVNFAANAPQFAELQPKWYVLVDPLFFSISQAPNLLKLRQALGEVTWPMTLIVPAGELRRAASVYGTNSNISLLTINAIGIEGFDCWQHMVFDSRRGMPRPRNVLIPSLMAGIWLGYKQIYIVGADHSWMQSIYVDDENHVVSVQQHFYKDDEAEARRVRSEYAGYHLHDIVHSFYVAFRSYHYIAAYAAARGVTITNSTPASYIDAFSRAPLP